MRFRKGSAAAWEQAAAKMDQSEMLRQVWYNRLVFERMKEEDWESDEPGEFELVMARLIRKNLNAVFSEDVDADECVEEFAQVTVRNWHLLVELVKVLDTCLGPIRNEQSREITSAVMDCMRKKWLKRTS
jgi:hypothetical protein